MLLRELTLADKNAFHKALNEAWEEDFIFAHYFETLAQNNFNTYVKILPELSRGLHLPSGHVPCTLLFAFDEKGKIVGRTSIRHELTEFLKLVGGHIGYGVVPSERRKGFASAILKGSLKYMKEQLPEIPRALVTCDNDNIGSIKTIERNGGIMEDVQEKRRYWIRL